MVAEVEADDLSGANDGASVPLNESTLADAVLRRRLRIGATVIGALVLVGLGFMLWTAVSAASANIQDLKAPGVSVIGTLALALTVLAIALIRSVFADTGHADAKTRDGPVITTGGLEAVKELVNALSAVVSSLPKK